MGWCCLLGYSQNRSKIVILRAGIGQGGSDSVYENYYQKCKQIGMPVGAYWYTKQQR